jgi:hypothetical protein
MQARAVKNGFHGLDRLDRKEKAVCAADGLFVDRKRQLA